MTTASKTTQMVRLEGECRRRSAGTARTVPRIRLVAEVAALVLIAVLLIALPILSRGTSNAVSAATAEVIAQPGDTLWSVAQANPLPGLTTAQTADYLAELNGIESSHIAVGSSILVPATSGGLVLACN